MTDRTSNESDSRSDTADNPDAGNTDNPDAGNADNPDAGNAEGDRPEIDIAVVGDERLSLTRSDFETFPTVEFEYTIVCDSGSRTTATWTGVSLSDLLDRAGMPPETTHLRVTSTDGYTVCVDIASALNSLVAYARDHESLGAVEQYATRFLGPGIDGSRTVKGVARVEPITLASGTDPTERESMSLDDPSYG
ncbi:molybdopterin-dependent oxidoreductase [Haloferax mediterranei]|nr:molybdopterin-dependent oxidoreductase [Haloferax mediterranei]